jgi:DNA-binding HxlR family transcriptional regulator
VASDPTAGESGLRTALGRVGERWSLLVVEALLDGDRRFSDLAGAVPGIAPNILSARLRDLERAGVVVARPYSDRPPRMIYALTADGQALAPAIRALAGWGDGRSGGETRDDDADGGTIRL